MLWCRQLEDSYTNIAESYKKCKEKGWDNIIDDDMLKIVAKGGYIRDNGLKGVEKGYKPYYDYLKYGNKLQQQEEIKEEPIMIEDNEGNENTMMVKDLMMHYNNELYECYKEYAKIYDNCKKENREKTIDDKLLKRVAKGGYIHDNGFEGVEEGYKPYYDYLKYDNNYEYTTPYSFEYEPYFSSDNNYSITFDHEVDTSDSIQMIEELYNEDNIEEDVDSNEIIDVLSFLSNKVKEVKKTIIHYISNYRPMYNQYTDTIEAVLIE